MGEALEYWRQRMEGMLEEALAEGKWPAEAYGEWAADFDVGMLIEELEDVNDLLVVYSDLPSGAEAVDWWTRESIVNYRIFRFCEQNDFEPEGIHLIIFESYPHPSAEEFILKFTGFAEAEEADWPFQDPFMICDISWQELVEHYRNGQGEDRTEVFRDPEHCTKW